MRPIFSAVDREHQVKVLCWSHNDAIAPYVPRTDHEHKCQSQRARAIRHRLLALGASLGREYMEDVNGRYWSRA